MADLVHKQFFGDRERDFALTPTLAVELERLLDAGIGTVNRRMFSAEFRLADIREVIRLALIGGGETPEDAAALIAAYVDARPLIESYSLALAILEAFMFGRGASPEGAGEVLQSPTPPRHPQEEQAEVEE